MKTETIAAIATGLSESGIGIVRVSGSDSIETVDRIFRTEKGKRTLLTVKSHTMHYGYIVDNKINEAETKTENSGGAIFSDWKQLILDEVMVSVMKAPRSYTAEDVVEINCHGGILVMREILENVLKAGARLAEPGEFTKRAFLNGRIDLTEAEAVMDLIRSQNDRARSSSIEQMKGSVSSKIKQLRENILYEIAFIESALDDPEHISLEGYREKLLHKLEVLEEEIKNLINSFDQGKWIKEGINTVIVGKPNVGKSSLLNLMAGEERAIVTEVAGTTRDILQESVTLHGISLNIIDTAGIHNPNDIVEKIGVEKAVKYAQKADLILFLTDGSVPLDENDRRICSLIRPEKTIILLNKSDLKNVVEEKEIFQMAEREDLRVIRTSTLENSGMEELENAIANMFFKGGIPSGHEVIITNLRHKEALRQAYEDLSLVKKSILDNLPEDFFSIDLMNAYTALGTIIGEETGEDLINEIFSKFCMGK